MATLGSPEPPHSPSSRRRRRSFLRRCERYCCTTLTYFPLAFVYGLTTWAVWVQTRLGFLPTQRYIWSGLLRLPFSNLLYLTCAGPTVSIIGIILYILLNWSYSTAVFTDPGSPSSSPLNPSSLPITEPRYASLTVKSTGEIRFCKKCSAKKPDRAHHCSTCKRCVLKMDHHCPWLATCVGLRNYKAFLLFLIYVTLFCWACFAISASWIYGSVFVDGFVEEQTMMPVHYILLAVLSGIIGLVIGGFTAWHLYLACRNQTTIESLEKTRYLSPLRHQIQPHLRQAQQRTYVDPENHSLGESLRDLGDRLTEIHANVLPGVLRQEEGEERTSPSPAQRSLQQNLSWAQQEEQRERDRYQDYLDERDSEHLPNAFDLGWRRNMRQVFGPNPLLWWLPICNSEGDGWSWDLSQKWIDASEDIKRRRQYEMQLEQQRESAQPTTTQGFAVNSAGNVGMRRSPTPNRTGSRVNQNVDGTDWSVKKQGNSTPLQRLSPSHGNAQMDGADDFENSSDEEAADGRRRLLRPSQQDANGSWNDVPEDFLNGRAPGRSSSRRDRRR